MLKAKGATLLEERMLMVILRPKTVCQCICDAWLLRCQTCVYFAWPSFVQYEIILLAIRSKCVNNLRWWRCIMDSADIVDCLEEFFASAMFACSYVWNLRPALQLRLFIWRCKRTLAYCRRFWLSPFLTSVAFKLHQWCHPTSLNICYSESHRRRRRGGWGEGEVHVPPKFWKKNIFRAIM